VNDLRVVHLDIDAAKTGERLLDGLLDVGQPH